MILRLGICKNELLAARGMMSIFMGGTFDYAPVREGLMFEKGKSV